MISREELERLQRAREPRVKKSRGPIAKVSPKRKKQMQVDKELAEKDKAFYLEVWNASPHNCQNCGVYLGKTCNNIFMHHVLFKSKRPDLRHVHENIMLLCLSCHDQVHRQPDKTPAVNARAEELEKLFPI